MASLPINFGDIVRGIELCIWIRKHCFDPVNSADIHYAQFEEDIRGLKNRLIQLQAAFENALSQVSSLDLSGHALLKLEADEMIGNFNATLAECISFLKENSKLAGGRASTWDNFVWHSSSRMEELRSRIQSHSYKIYLIIEPVQLQLLTDVAATTQEILELLRKHFQIESSTELPRIPGAIATRFAEALKRNCPLPLESASQIPLVQGVDVLSFHFRECTTHPTSSAIPPDLEHKLSLLKAHWLVLVLEASQSFNQSRPGSLYRRIVKQVKLGVEEQYNFRQITDWNENDFEKLNDAAFSIWPVAEAVKPRVITDPTGREEKLADLPLESPYAGQKESLVILRVSDTTLRTVLSRSFLDEPSGVQTIERTEKFFDPHTDGLAPLYTIAQRSGRRWNVNVDYGKGGHVAYELQSREDVFSIQRSLTGYEPFHYSEDVFCAVTYKPSSFLARLVKPRYKQLTGRGEVQVWRWQSMTRSRKRLASAATPNSETEGRSNQSSHLTNHSQAFSGIDPGVLSILETENGEEIVLTEMPRPPLLVSFMQKGERFTMWQAELSDLRITETRRLSNGFFRTVLQHVKSESFDVRIICVTKSEMEYWNLCALVIPDHKSLKGTKQNEADRGECTSLALDFRSGEEQSVFEQAFKGAVGERLAQTRHFLAARRTAQTQGHKPIRRSTLDSAGSLYSATSDQTVRAFNRPNSVPALPPGVIIDSRALERMDSISPTTTKMKNEG